jgi:hypothetical protein
MNWATMIGGLAWSRQNLRIDISRVIHVTFSMGFQIRSDRMARASYVPCAWLAASRLSLRELLSVEQ